MSAEIKTIRLLRHAKSSWDDQSLNDHDRPLNKRGKRTAPLMAQALAGWINQGPDLVLVSSAARTQETWSLVEPILTAKLGTAFQVRTSRKLSDLVLCRAQLHWAMEQPERFTT